MHFPAPGNPLPVVRLSPPDRLLLWAIRTWVIAMQRRRDAGAPLRAAFGRYGIPDAVDLVDALMCIVARGAARALDIECVCNPVVSADESRILAAAALHQRKRGFEAKFILREILCPAASDYAATLLDRLAAVLSGASAELSEWPVDRGQFAFTAGPPSFAIAPTVH